MKHLLCLFALICFTGAVQADEIKCQVELKPVGIYYNYCPRGALMDANGTRVNIVGNSVFVDDRVRCVRPEVVCTKVEEKVDKQELFEDN